VTTLATSIESMMRSEEPSEVALIRESGRWCAHAHRLLQEYSRPGATEAEASLRAGHEATLAMLEELATRTAVALLVGGVSAGTAARSACAARGRTRSRTTSSSSRATCS
jgi:hypothetical protein